jgi:hypothetical protein
LLWEELVVYFPLIKHGPHRNDASNNFSIVCICCRGNVFTEPLSSKAFPININLALTIYKSLIRSILTYAASVYGYAPKRHINKLQIFQNKVLRIITNLPRLTPIETLHEQTGMETIQTHVSRIATKLYLKSQLSDNPQIRQLGQYNPIQNKHKRSCALLTE